MRLRLAPLLAILALPAIAQTPPPSRPAATPTAPLQGAQGRTPAAEAPAAGGAAPERTTATFGDWVLRCEARAANAPGRHCELLQSLQDQRGQPVAQFAFGRTTRNAPIRVVVLIPANITVAAPMRLNLDDGGQPIPIVLRACGPRGCVADGEVDAATIARLRGREAQGRLEYRDATNAEVALPFSPRGFAQALDALSREIP